MSNHKFITDLDKIRESIPQRPKNYVHERPRTPTEPKKKSSRHLTKSVEKSTQPEIELPENLIPPGLMDSIEESTQPEVNLQDFQIKKDLTESDILTSANFGAETDDCPEGYKVVTETPTQTDVVAREPETKETLTQVDTTAEELASVPNETVVQEPEPNETSSSQADTTSDQADMTAPEPVPKNPLEEDCGRCGQKVFIRCISIEDMERQIGCLTFEEMLDIAEGRFLEEYSALVLGPDAKDINMELLEYKYLYCYENIYSARKERDSHTTSFFLERADTELMNFIKIKSPQEFVEIYHRRRKLMMESAKQLLDSVDTEGMDERSLNKYKYHVRNTRETFELTDHILLVLFPHKKLERKTRNKK